jgi:hypothetical protein
MAFIYLTANNLTHLMVAQKGHNRETGESPVRTRRCDLPLFLEERERFSMVMPLF